ncbi:helix-turn-helix domain-containing protein, partial [Enterococcus faecalis]
PYKYLLENDYVKENTVVKKTETVTQHSEDHSYRVFNYYSHNQERNFELFQFELDPRKKYQAVGHSKASTEYVMLIQVA